MSALKKLVFAINLFLFVPLSAFALPDGTLKRNIVVLDHEYHFYHWAMKEKVSRISQSTDFNSATARTYARNVILYESERADRSIWSGLYFALDPIVSASYGTRPSFNDNVRFAEDWALMEVILPKGARFLNLYTTSDARGIYDGLLSATERSWLRDHGCEASSVKDISNSLCTRAFNTYIQEAGVDGVLYLWGRTAFSFCPGHSDPNQYALILKSPEIVTKAKVSLFTQESSKRPDQIESLRLINSFWKNNSSQTSDETEAKATPVFEIFSPFDFDELPAVSSEKLRTFARQKLLGCLKAIEVHP